MSRRYTELEIIVRANYIGPEAVPHTCSVEDQIIIQLPVMDEKFVDLPKPVQGLLLAVYASHRSAVSDWMGKEAAKKAKEEAERKERERMALWNQEPDDDGDDFVEYSVTLAEGPVLEFGSAAEAVEALKEMTEAINGNSEKAEEE